MIPPPPTPPLSCARRQRYLFAKCAWERKQKFARRTLFVHCSHEDSHILRTTWAVSGCEPFAVCKAFVARDMYVTFPRGKVTKGRSEAGKEIPPPPTPPPSCARRQRNLFAECAWGRQRDLFAGICSCGSRMETAIFCGRLGGCCLLSG